MSFLDKLSPAVMLTAVVAASSLLPLCEAFVVPTSKMLHASRTSPLSLRMSAGSDYVASLPGAPFSDGQVWDPVGLSDGADPSDIKKWREAEIKHGRVAMLASVGVLVAEVSNTAMSASTVAVTADGIAVVRQLGLLAIFAVVAGAEKNLVQLSRAGKKLRKILLFHQRGETVPDTRVQM